MILLIKLKAKFHMRLGASKQAIGHKGSGSRREKTSNSGRHSGHQGVKLNQEVSLGPQRGVGVVGWRTNNVFSEETTMRTAFKKGSCYLITRICSTTVLTVYNYPSVRDRQLAAALQ